MVALKRWGVHRHNFSKEQSVICTKVFEMCIFFNPEILYLGIYTMDKSVCTKMVTETYICARIKVKAQFLWHIFLSKQTFLQMKMQSTVCETLVESQKMLPRSWCILKRDFHFQWNQFSGPGEAHGQLFHWLLSGAGWRYGHLNVLILESGQV